MDKKIRAMSALLCILLVTSVFSAAAGKTKDADMTLLTTTASLSGAGSALLQDCPPCMVSYWKLDELSGALAHDSINGNHGGVFTDGDGMDPDWAPGIAGNALDFAGDAPDAVVIGDHPAYHFGTGDFALEAWIKYEGPTDGSVMYPAIMSKRPGPEGSNPLEGFCLCLTYWPASVPGTLLMRIEDINYYPCSTPVDDGNWHHVVVQRCRGQVEFYVDGQLDGTAQSNKNATTDAGLSLGLDPKSSFETAWEGFLDEVAVYNCCLSSKEIALHFLPGVEGEGYCSEEEPCGCGEWNGVHVTWTDSDPDTTDEWTGSCGDVVGTILNCPGNPITVNSSITCSPCEEMTNPSYSWNVTGPQGYEDHGNSLPVEFIPLHEGTYEVTLNATCPDEKCIPCTITLGKVVFCECACLYSGSDDMEMLTSGAWDISNPSQGVWEPINTIPQNQADASDWGQRFPDLPWSFMYDMCASWVYGHNNPWNSPHHNEHEYYRLPFTVSSGECVELHFSAYIDDAAKFYIDGPGLNGPTLFYQHDPAVSIYEHDSIKFDVDVDGTPGADCLEPGAYTIYIDHWDTRGVIYGLIFTAECPQCTCEQSETPNPEDRENGPCLGTVLLAGIIALGAIVLQKRKD